MGNNLGFIRSTMEFTLYNLGQDELGTVVPCAVNQHLLCTGAGLSIGLPKPPLTCLTFISPAGPQPARRSLAMVHQTATAAVMVEIGRAAPDASPVRDVKAT